MIHDSAAAGFQRNASVYASIRPSYHPRLLQRFGAHVDTGNTLVELGAGTGIFTAQLLQAGYAPIAVEPVQAMRAHLTRQFPAVNVRVGTAEETGLPNASVDAVVVAQAFHWFNFPLALAEIKRILRPGGLLACVWNVRDESIPWMRAYEKAVNQYAGTAPRYSSLAWRHAIDADPAFALVDEYAIANPQPTNADGVITRALSTSFVANLSAQQQQNLERELRAIVVPLGESFDFPYTSTIQLWRIGTPSRHS